MLYALALEILSFANTVLLGIFAKLTIRCLNVALNVVNYFFCIILDMLHAHALEISSIANIVSQYILAKLTTRCCLHILLTLLNKLIRIFAAT